MAPRKDRRWGRILIGTIMATCCLLMIGYQHRSYYGSSDQQASKQHDIIEQAMLLANIVHEKYSSSAATQNDDNDNNNMALKKKKENKGWAYVYLIGGCNPDYPERYIGYIYNIMVSTYRLKTLFNSQADIVVMIQMSIHTNATTLSKHEEDLMRRVGVARIVYVPKEREIENFYTIIMGKFYLFNLYQYNYRRVMFLDGDVMPYCSLDYLFQLVERGALRSNVILSATGAAAQAHHWLVTLEQNDYACYRAIVERLYRYIRETNATAWPGTLGWGAQILRPNPARCAHRHLYAWNWYGVIADQGLLYYWVRFYKRDFSVFNNEELESWSWRGESLQSSSPSSSPRTTTELSPKQRQQRQQTEVRLISRIADANNQSNVASSIYANATCLPRYLSEKGRYGHDAFVMKYMLRYVPYRDIAHFQGPRKPWTRYWNYWDDFALPTFNEYDNVTKSYQLWYYNLYQIKHKYNLSDEVLLIGVRGKESAKSRRGRKEKKTDQRGSPVLSRGLGFQEILDAAQSEEKRDPSSSEGLTCPDVSPRMPPIVVDAKR